MIDCCFDIIIEQVLVDWHLCQSQLLKPPNPPGGPGPQIPERSGSGNMTKSSNQDERPSGEPKASRPRCQGPQPWTLVTPAEPRLNLGLMPRLHLSRSRSSWTPARRQVDDRHTAAGRKCLWKEKQGEFIGHPTPGKQHGLNQWS